MMSMYLLFATFLHFNHTKMYMHTLKCTCMCVVLNLAELYDEEKDTNLVRENDGEM